MYEWAFRKLTARDKCLTVFYEWLRKMSSIIYELPSNLLYELALQFVSVFGVMKDFNFRVNLKFWIEKC